MAGQVFQDRREAGRLLGERLRTGAYHEGLVLALPRGGVPVAFEVAEALDLALDLMLVRKLGLPGQEELAMGAIASGGAVVFNDELLQQLRVPEEAIQRVMGEEQTELARREVLYRGERAMPAMEGRDLIVVDDGLATGATMRAAIAALRQVRPRRIIAAVPVAPADSVQVLEQEADAVVALRTPTPFLGVGRWYENFGQTSDQEVRELLARAWRERKETS